MQLHLVAVKEVDVGGRNALILMVPAPQVVGWQKIQTKIVRELEKKFSGKHLAVAFLASLAMTFLCPMIITCLPENFFSSSRTILVWIFCQPTTCGAGTIRIKAFRPPTSTSLTATK